MKKWMVFCGLAMTLVLLASVLALAENQWIIPSLGIPEVIDGGNPCYVDNGWGMPREAMFELGYKHFRDVIDDYGLGIELYIDGAQIELTSFRITNISPKKILLGQEEPVEEQWWDADWIFRIRPNTLLPGPHVFTVVYINEGDRIPRSHTVEVVYD